MKVKVKEKNENCTIQLQMFDSMVICFRILADQQNKFKQKITHTKRCGSQLTYGSKGKICISDLFKDNAENENHRIQKREV